MIGPLLKSFLPTGGRTMLLGLERPWPFTLLFSLSPLLIIAVAIAGLSFLGKRLPKGTSSLKSRA